MRKLNKSEAKKQLARMLSNPTMAPRTDVGSQEIIDCLIRNCRDESHAQAAMTAFLDGVFEYPRGMDGNTARLAFCAASTAGATEHAPAGCSVCSLGPDPFTGAPRWADHVSRDLPNGSSCAGRCIGREGEPCERGRWLAAKDIERKAAMFKHQQPKRAGHAPHEHPADADWQRRAAGDE